MQRQGGGPQCNCGMPAVSEGRTNLQTPLPPWLGPLQRSESSAQQQDLLVSLQYNNRSVRLSALKLASAANSAEGVSRR